MSRSNPPHSAKVAVTGVEDKSDLEECFVIMPISDQTGYDAGHFTKVYEDIFKPACASAGYKATRADDTKESNLIHLDILKRVVHSPMAICDLSSRNPNVLFELGLRQAFDKPTILVKDKETPEIFDIAPIRYTNYRQALRYREVLEDQNAITHALLATKRSIGQEHNVNSLVKLLELAGPATINENRKSDPQDYLQILMAEVSQLKHEVRAGRMLAAKHSSPVGLHAPSRSPSAAPPPSIAVQRMREFIGKIEIMIAKKAPSHIFRKQLEEAIEFAEHTLDFYNSNPTPITGPDVQQIEEFLDYLRTLQLI